jgi:hypothetical protein
MAEHINPDRLKDSAGVPWAGRSFEPNPNQDDDGSADPMLVDAIAKFQNQQGEIEAVKAALQSARVLVPLVAELGEAGEGAHGQTVDKSADLSIVTVSTPDNQTGIPVFSSVDAMKVWNPDARPVPTDMPRVALAAAQEKSNRIILDPGSKTEFVVRRPMLEAIAQNIEWQAPWKSEKVKDAFAAALKGDAAVENWAFYSEDHLARLTSPELTVLVKLKEGLEEADINALVERLMEAWKHSAEIGLLVDSMQLKLTR